jgi:hypothetical protein
MNNAWSMTWTRSRAATAKPEGTTDAFADPLERAEWEGLGWSIPLIARLTAGAGREMKTASKINQVERFTAPAGANGVCVS